jgi:hypothetical protein
MSEMILFGVIGSSVLNIFGAGGYIAFLLCFTYVLWSYLEEHPS